MTPRARKRLLIVAVVLGVPVIVAVALLAYVGSGGLERRLVAEYAARFPGRLQIGRIEVAGAASADLHQVRLSAPGGSPVVDVPFIAAGGSLLPPGLERLRLERMQVTIDRAAVVLLRELLAAVGEAGDGGGGRLRLDAAGDLTIGERGAGAEGGAGAVTLAGFALSFDRDAGRITAGFTADLVDAQGRHPLELAVDTIDGADGPLHRLTIRQGSIGLADLFATLTALGFMPDQGDLLPWLPSRPDFAGSVLTIDPRAGTMRGPVQLAWTGGGGATVLDLDGQRLVLDPARGEDAQLGSGEGRLEVRFDTRALTVDLARWAPGPRLPIPRNVPVPAILGLLPAGHLVLEQEERGVSLRFDLLPAQPTPAGAPPATAAPAPALTLAWRSDGPLTVRASRVPLTLAQPFLPDGLLVEAGRIESLALVWQDLVQDLEASVSGARAAYRSWALADFDARVHVVPLDATDERRGFVSDVILPFASMRHAGTAAGAAIGIDVLRLDELVRRIEGPSPLPALHGALTIGVEVTSTEQALTGQVKRLVVSGFGREQVVRDLAVTADGSFVLDEAGLQTRISGRLRQGQLGLPSGWLDLALRTPVFTTTLLFSPGRREIKEALVRAADEHGGAVAGGFTAGLHGVILADLGGTIEGVVDRADLAWFKTNTTLVPLPKGSEVAGEGAVTFTARFEQGRIEDVRGHFLPLNVDLKLLGGTLDIKGIQGALDFTITRTPPAP